MTQSIKNHDLFDFMRQITDEMESEYTRIQRRSADDPGTAGDQGEENWATLLRGWLPTTYEVVTKGRIIGHDGVTSPQIDVLVLNSSYPAKMRDKKMILAGGVVAAFECKNTLKANHLQKVVQTCKVVKGLCPRRTGSPYKELQAPIIYGLLAHSHTWKGQNSKPIDNVEQTIFAYEALDVKAPHELIDLICVADLATWVRSKIIWLGTTANSLSSNKLSDVTTALVGHSGSHLDGAPAKNFTAIGTLIGGLFQKLAYEDPSTASMARYYSAVGMQGSGSGTMRPWPASVFSDTTRAKIVKGGLEFDDPSFNEWSQHLD